MQVKLSELEKVATFLKENSTQAYSALEIASILKIDWLLIGQYANCLVRLGLVNTKLVGFVGNKLITDANVNAETTEHYYVWKGA